MENSTKTSDPIDADQLMILLRRRNIKLVILNACKTAAQSSHQALAGVAPALVKAEIPAVIAMQFNVPDNTALGFTLDLYRSLMGGLPLDEAVTEMRIGAYISGEDKYYWGIPTLFMRSPDGMLWQRTPELLDKFNAVAAEVLTIVTEEEEVTMAQQLAAIVTQVEALKGELDAGDAEDIMDYLTEAVELFADEKPSARRIKRKLKGATEILEASSHDEAAALAPKLIALNNRAQEEYGK